MKPVIIVHHHEIILKRDNRAFFEKKLISNIRTVLAGIVPPKAVGGGYGKFIIRFESETNIQRAIEVLKNVFGLANICSGVEVGQDLQIFCETAEQLLDGHEFRTIKVETRRPDKNFPIRSMDVNAKVGEYLCKRFNVRANLTNPDETIYIEILDKVAYVYRSKVKGAGGLPVGVSGKVVALLSAGFDSPVAAWQMMKRGATVIFVHFHSMPYTSRDSVDQVRRLADILTKYQIHSKLYLVPFAEIQNKIVLEAPQPLRVILYRRMMIRISEMIAYKEGAEALVTGEAVGQVASQTLRNIRVINDVATLPILRPLSGMDKEETMALARRIGTYDISKDPFDDCCSFLAPRKPETWASQSEVERAELKFNIPSFIELAKSTMSLETFSLIPSNAESSIEVPSHQ